MLHSHQTCSKKMASRGRILALMLVVCVVLTLLASTEPRSFDPDITGLKIRNGTSHNLLSLLEYGFRIRGIRGETGSYSGTARGYDPVSPLIRGKGNKGDKETKKKKEKEKKKKPPQKPVEPEPKLDPNEGPEQVPGDLKLGFYQQTCPQAERIIQETMNKIFQRNVKIAPALVRLFFHDCFVTGCDASILLEKTPSGEKVEREADQNGNFVTGFEEIEEVKAALEAECPGIVSCADVVAFATREALAQTGVPRYPLAAGRRDRPVSLAENVNGNLPYPNATAQEMIAMFVKKGMTLEDLVVLIGAHSIGEAHCSVVSTRFQDPEKTKDINPRYIDQLHVQLICVDPEQKLPFDRMSQNIMDVGYYKQLLAHETLIESDHNLVNEVNANGIMKKYADDQAGWLAKFTRSIIKLGELEVLSGNQGEIRRQCRAVN